MSLTLSEARKLLPNVGDRLIRIKRSHNTQGGYTYQKASGVVDYVNRRHLWYRVRFKDGLTQCYKVPEPEYQQEEQEA